MDGKVGLGGKGGCNRAHGHMPLMLVIRYVTHGFNGREAWRTLWYKREVFVWAVESFYLILQLIEY